MEESSHRWHKESSRTEKYILKEREGLGITEYDGRVGSGIFRVPGFAVGRNGVTGCVLGLD